MASKFERNGGATLSVGQPYNPGELFYGVFIPEWLLSRQELSPGAKLLFGCLSRHAFRCKGRCAPSQKDLAADLGTSPRQLRRYTTELQDYLLINVRQNGLTEPNVYTFMAHAWFLEAEPVELTISDCESGVKKRISAREGGEDNLSGQERTHMSGQERSDVSTHSTVSTVVQKGTVDSSTYCKQKEEKVPVVLPQEALLWNSKGLPEVLDFGPKRTRTLRTRLGSAFFRANFAAAVDKVLASDFCMGKNDRGWRAEFDWMLQSDTVAKIMEGKYDNRKVSAPAVRPPMTAETFWPAGV